MGTTLLALFVLLLTTILLEREAPES